MTNDTVDNVFLAGFFIIYQVYLFFLLSCLSSFFPSLHASIHHSPYKHFLALELALNLQGNREKMILDPALGDHKMWNRAKTLEYLDEQPKKFFFRKRVIFAPTDLWEIHRIPSCEDLALPLQECPVGGKQWFSVRHCQELHWAEVERRSGRLGACIGSSSWKAS